MTRPAVTAARVLVVVAHPDDEAFFLGGTIALLARTCRVRLVVVTDGAHGKEAALGPDGRVTAVVQPAGASARLELAARRRQECRDSARVLGVDEVEFLGWPEGFDHSHPILLCALRRRMVAFGPDVVLTHNEAGTTGHPDHSWVALVTHQAVVETARRHDDLPRAMFTCTLPEAAQRFDHWGELRLSGEQRVTIDVSDHVDAREQACRSHRSQAHWVEYMEKVGLLHRSTEEFVPRWLRPGHRVAADDLVRAAMPCASARVCVPMPLPRDGAAYTSSFEGLDAEIRQRAQALRAHRLRGVVLASGYGSRMGNPVLPKSMELLGGEPLLRHIVRALEEADVDEAPLVVIGPRGGLIREAFGTCSFVDQGEPKGTAHALACAESAFGAEPAGHVVVVHGDMPLISAASLRRLTQAHLAGGAVMTMSTVRLQDFDGPNAVYGHHGRVLRDPAGRVVRVVEHADAGPEVLARTEVNAGLYAFDTRWLWTALAAIRPDNRRAEYYLTDAVHLAAAAGHRVATVELHPDDALGVNCRAELETAEQILQTRRRAAPSSPCAALQGAK